MTIKGDPEAMLKVASNVKAEPCGYIDRAHKTIASDTHLPSLAFGIAPSIAISGPYEQGRSALEGAGQRASEAFHGVATGLTNVAKAMSGAEHANTPINRPAELQPTGISSDGSDRAGTQAGAMTVEVMLLLEWLSTGGTLTACSFVAPSAIAAVVTWGLVEPDDASLSRAISAWESAAQDVGYSKQYLDNSLKPLDAAWPEEDSSRQAYDRWMIPFNTDVNTYVSAVNTMRDTLKGAVDQIHEVQNESFMIAAVSLGVLLSLSVLELVPFAAPIIEPLKEAAGVVLGVEIGANVVVMGVIAKNLFDQYNSMNKSAEGFQMGKPGSHDIPKFQDVKIDWVNA